MITINAVGFLGDKPQVLMVSPTAQKCEFDVIAERRVKSGGEWVTVYERSTFVAWNEEAEQLATILDKGSVVNCCGVQETSHWIDKATGQKRSKTKYQLTVWSFAPTRRAPPAAPPMPPARQQPATYGQAIQQAPTGRTEQPPRHVPDHQQWKGTEDDSDHSQRAGRDHSDREYRPSPHHEEKRPNPRDDKSDFIEM